MHLLQSVPGLQRPPMRPLHALHARWSIRHVPGLVQLASWAQSQQDAQM